MQPEPKQAAAHAASEEITICPNCHVPMPSMLRFCRSCGYRLGEGVAEYAETVRLPNQQRAATPSATTASAAANATSPQSGAGNWSPLMASAQGAGRPVAHAPAYFGECQKKSGRRRAPWIVWLVLGVTIASVTGGSMLSPFGLRNRGRSAASRSAARSYVGPNKFETTTGGVTFDSVMPPGSPMDKAGLVGGDIITAFDGQMVTSADQLMKLLVATPVGKTVEVIYTRDGETKRTQLTTISKDESGRLEEQFGSRIEGKGYLGIDDWERVPIPGTNLYGVRIDDVVKNDPAYMAGMRDGDIIIEFDGTPIRASRELIARIKRALPNSVVKVIVMRGTERLEFLIKIGVDD
ncbi:MAG TPA: PDZ domain-containing protein [Pyrinomonadaceae bacterium]|jgi:membrane-associated protease RseP (regulator of RpoE activity)|nr:PDZ domain-containing protein [Pyrinomonadaceae bacterium]